MYLLNCGLYDAKGVVHPTVLAMEHGLAWPRHRVVGSAWQHAHEWVRHNLQWIVDTLKTHDADLDLIMSMNLPSECFAAEESPEVGVAGWCEEFTGLGTARHAFPKTTFRTASFARDPNGRQHLTCISDGDHSMWKHLREGLGNGNTAAWHIDACSSHLWRNLESMVNRDIKHAQAIRKKNVAAWDRKHPAGKLLHEDEYNPTFQSIFGDWVDVSMQHDVAGIANLAWTLALDEAILMGLKDGAERWNKHHKPSGGRQGVWGRATHTYESGLACTNPRHPLATVVAGGLVLLQNKGDASSSGSLESRFNKAVKKGCGASLPMGPLCTALDRVCKDLSRDSANLGFSLLPDFFGKCTSISSHKFVGRHKRTATRKDFRFMFKMGIRDATNPAFEGHYHKINKANGKMAEYIVASDSTITLVRHTLIYRNSSDPIKETQEFVGILRDCWLRFMEEPREYVTQLRRDAKGWTFDRVQNHFIGKLPKGFGMWRRTRWQIAQIVKNDVLYLTHAFHKVVPRHHLNPDESRRVMGETWRRILPRNSLLFDVWDTDIRFFECLHCYQYSKSQFCKHVTAVMLREKVLPGLPRSFDAGGIVEDNNKHNGDNVVTNRWGIQGPAGSPIKEAPGSQSPGCLNTRGKPRQSYSSQAMRRRPMYAVGVS